MAAVQDLLGLTPGKHMVHFKLSYAPHQPPPGKSSKVTLKSTALAMPKTISIPTGVTTFSEELEFSKSTVGPVPVTLDAPEGCEMATLKVKRHDVPAFITVGIKSACIVFAGSSTKGPFEDGQKAKFKFRLENGAGRLGAKAVLKSNTLKDPVRVEFAPFATDKTEIEVEGEFIKVADALALNPKPERGPDSLRHPFELKSEEGCGAVAVEEKYRGQKGTFTDSLAKWWMTIDRPLVVLDPKVTERGPYKPGDKVQVRVFLPHGAPKVADIEAELECPSLVGGPHKVTSAAGSGQSEKNLELTVADILDPKGIEEDRLEGMQYEGLVGVKSLDLIGFKKDSLKNCLAGGSDLDYAVPGVLIALKLLEVNFHKEHPYRPDTGLFAGEKVVLTITHSYEAPAGAEVEIESAALQNTPITKALDQGKLVTTAEVFAIDSLRPGTAHKIKIKAKTLCKTGSRDQIKVDAHIPATLMFGGKRKHRIEPDQENYEAGTSVSLTVHLEYHPRGLPNKVATAPSGGCHFAIECPGFAVTPLLGVISPGRSETVVSAVLANPGTHVAKLRLADPKAGNALSDALRGCRVDSEPKDNSLTVTVNAVTRLKVFFDDTVQTIPTVAKTPGSTDTIKVKLSAPVPMTIGTKNVVAKVASTAFTEPYLVTFRKGEQEKSVTVTWSNAAVELPTGQVAAAGDEYQLVRVDGVKGCEADTETASTRPDPKITAPKRQHLFSVKFQLVNVTAVQRSPVVAGAEQENVTGVCKYEKFAIVERHGEKAEIRPLRGKNRDGVFEVPGTDLIQMVAGRKQDESAGQPEFHRTEILFRFPGKNEMRPANHKFEELHPAVYLFRINRKGNRLPAMPVDPHSEDSSVKQVTPGFWDIRYNVIANRDIRGLQVFQATLPFFETPNSVSGFWPGLWNKIKRSVPTADFWNMLRQQKPRLTHYEVELRECTTALRKVRIDVYPSDEYCLSIKVKPLAPFSWGLEGAVINSWGEVKPRDDLRNKSWDSQYYDKENQDYLKTSLTLRDQSTIGGLSNPGSALNMSSIISSQGRGRIPKVTVAVLNQLATASLKPEHEIIFEILPSYPPGAMTLNPGGLAVNPHDYVEWDGTKFIRTSKPGSLFWPVAELNALTPEDGALYKAKTAGTIKRGLATVEGKLTAKSVDVVVGQILSFNEDKNAWRPVSEVESGFASLNARYRKDKCIRKLTNDGKLTAGSVDGKTGDYVMWRASRKAWEKLDLSTAEELKEPPDQELYLEKGGSGIIGARFWNDGGKKWEPLLSKTPEELSQLILKEQGIYGVSGRGTVNPAIAVEENDALVWSAGAWKKLDRKRVENINPAAKDGDVCRTTDGFTFKGRSFDAGRYVEFSAGDWEEIDAKNVVGINGIGAPQANDMYELDDDGVLTKGSLAVQKGDLVKYSGGVWSIQSVPAHPQAWFTPEDFKDKDTFVISNSGKLLAGAVDVTAGTVVSFDGTNWSKVTVEGKFPVSFFNEPQVQDKAKYSIKSGGKIGNIQYKAGEVVTYDGPTKKWNKVVTDRKPQWETGWFDWKPLADEAYILSNNGTIDGTGFVAQDVAIYDGARWIKPPEDPLDAKVEDLNKPLVDGELASLTDAGKLKPGDVDVVIGNIVTWDESTDPQNPVWKLKDQSALVTWDPVDFDDRNEWLLNIFALQDAGTLTKGNLVVAAKDFVRFKSRDDAWVTTDEPGNSRNVRSIGYLDDSEMVSRMSGEDSRLPLTSLAKMQSSYCYYPDAVSGGLPESWGQKPTNQNKADEFQKLSDQYSLYAGFIPAIVGDRIQISMTRNGKEDALCAEMRRLAFTIAALVEGFRTLVSSSENTVPTMGYSVSAVINVMEGEFIVRWGWKEFTDQQVFYWEQIQANIMVVRVGARVDVGIRYSVIVARFEAIVYFKVTIELKWEKAWERQGPGQQMEGTAAWVSAIGKIELGVSIVLLHENWCSAAGALSSGIEAKVRWISANAGGLEYHIYFLGIRGNFRAKLLGFREFTFEKMLKKGSPQGIPWKRGMIPGTANPSYYEIRATYGLSMSKIIFDKNHLTSVFDSMVETQQQVLKERNHATTCGVCTTAGVPAKGRGWPIAERPNEPGWDEQWNAWIKSIAAERAAVPQLRVRKLMRYAINAVVKVPMYSKLEQLERERKELVAKVQARLDLAEKKLDEIAGLEKQVDDAEEAGDERPETVDELYRLAQETQSWMLEVRNGDPEKPKQDRISIGNLTKDIRWWCRRMEHYTSFQQHWKA
jgi:hypothetical protein